MRKKIPEIFQLRLLPSNLHDTVTTNNNRYYYGGITTMCVEIGTHVRDQAALKGIGLDVIQAVLANPAITYKSFIKDDKGNRVPRMCNKHGVQQEKWTGEHNGTKVCLCVFTCCQKAVTVWFDQIETDIRPDQRRKGVKGYHGRNGQWRPA